MLTTTTLPDLPRRLPSADWIAAGVAVCGLLASRLFQYGPLYGLVALAVFGPPVLRELGLLKDHDEYTRVIMYRAGLHAFLIAGMLLLGNRLLRHYYDRLPDPMDGTLYVSLESMYHTVIVVYLISYLIQYWGPRLGVFRILLAFAAINLIELAGMRGQGHGGITLEVAGSILLLAGVIVGLAFLVRRWPRVGGGLLLAFVVLSAALLARPETLTHALWSVVSSLLQLTIAFGACGVALLHVGAKDEE